MRRLWMTLALGFAMIGQVAAANCSGSNCACGDTLTSHYTMRGNFSCPGQNGIRIGSGVTLTCNNWAISGTPTASNVGIEFVGHHAKIIGCHVSGFHLGITTNGFDGIHIRGLHAGSFGSSHNNGDGTQGSYGIHIEPGSCGYLIKWMLIYHNDDEGIHNAAACSNTTYGTIEANSLWANTDEELYFINANRSAVVIGNYVDGGSGTAVRLKNSSGNAFLGNDIVDGNFTIDENSDGNGMEDNTLGSGILRLRGVSTSRPDGNYMVRWRTASPVLVYDLDNPGINNICDDCTFNGGNPDAQCRNFHVSPGTNTVISPNSGTLGTNDTGPSGNLCITVMP